MPLDPTAVTEEQVRELIADRLANGKPTTELIRIRSLKTFFRWRLNEDEIEAGARTRNRRDD
jgi:hypothetical protein